MRTILARWLVIYGLVIVVFAFNLYADSVRVSTSFKVLPYQTLSITGMSSSQTVFASVQLPSPNQVDLQRGFMIQHSAVHLAVESNVPWVLQVHTDNEHMGVSGDATYTKPISDFQLRSTFNSDYMAISNDPQVLLNHVEGEYEFDVDYKLMFDAQAHKAGSYQLDLIYTITSQ